MLLEELSESRNWDIKGVVAIVMLQLLNLGLGGDTPGLLEVLNLRLRLGINGVCQRRERILLFVPEEASLLEQKGGIGLAPGLSYC
jgi:hypothetical protein